MDRLCRAYWYPLYAFIRRQGYGPEAAEKLTQEFFARLVSKDYLAAVHPEKGQVPVVSSGGAERKGGRLVGSQRKSDHPLATFDP